MTEHENVSKESLPEQGSHGKHEHQSKQESHSKPEGHWTSKWTTKSAAIGGFLAGILLVTVVWIAVSHYERENYRMMSFYNDRYAQGGRMNRFNNPYFGDIGRNIDEVGRLNNGMMGGLNLTPVELPQGAVVQDSSGTMAFYLNGNKLELPYSVKDKKLNMNVKSLVDFMNANPTEKVVFNISTSDGQSVGNFTAAKDFGGDQLNYDLKDGQRYIINLKITDAKGSQVVDARQVI